MNFIYTILPVICLIIGFYMGFSIKKEDKLPEVILPEIKSPKQIIEEKKEKKKEEEAKNELDQYLENIDNYPNNQKEFK